MPFDKKNIGYREDYFVATSKRSQGDQAYDDDGLPIYTERTSIEFWACVEDLPSVRTEYMGRYRMIQVKKIICDARDIELIDEDYTIVRDGEDDKYQIVDIVQTSFKFTAELIIERII